ncbi:MAG: RES family NAD+ phosphorylase [Syntrophorhabdaceae bacterium]
MFRDLLTNIIDFDDNAYRNIPTIIPSEDLLDDLSENPAVRAHGESLVSQLREDSDYSSIIDRPFRYGRLVDQNICRGMTTRFSDGARFGVWYGSLSLITTIYETAYHWRKRLLDDAGILETYEDPVISDRRIFKLRVAGILIDLRGKETKFPDLVSPGDYRFCQQVGDYLHQASQKGLLVRSARDIGGTNIAAFSPDILFDPRHQLYASYMSDKGRLRISLDTDEPKDWVSLEKIAELLP